MQGAEVGMRNFVPVSNYLRRLLNLLNTYGLVISKTQVKKKN
ncbi:MAG: hypothetical protein JWR54_2469 [Mucilaginibacter sp.]|nr:hypothetical protein [Mucilaginibacter sp.]